MSKFSACFPVLAAAGVCAWLVGCSSEVSEPVPSNASNAELASLESELLSAQGSLGGALDEAKACFGDFKECREAGGADCGDALKTCLPVPASIPAPAGGAGGSRGGFFGFGGGRLPLPGAGQPGSTSGSGLAGLAPRVDPAALAACKDDIRAAASGAQDLPAVAEAFKACVADAFADLFAGVCERIAEACDGAADAKVCERLNQACDDPALSP